MVYLHSLEVLAWLILGFEWESDQSVDCVFCIDSNRRRCVFVWSLFLVFLASITTSMLCRTEAHRELITLIPATGEVS